MVTNSIPKAGFAGRALALAALLSLLLAAREARADEAPPPKAPEDAAPPSLHHAPVVTAHPGEDVTIGASLDHPERLRRAMLVWRGDGGEGEAQFARSGSADRPYVAVIPGSFVRGDRLAYAVELETADGTRVEAFATRAAPHPVTVLEGTDDARESAELTRLGGRRSVVQASGELVSFGDVDAVVRTPNGDERRSVRDQYWRTEAAFTYRLLGVVSEFGLRAGAVRGTSLVSGEVDPGRYDVGLNYGAPRVRLRLGEWLHVEGELLTSVTEIGFSMGGGGAVLLGDPYGSKVVVGAEAIQVFGERVFTRLDLVASRRLVVAPLVEVTNMPHADRAGVRLVGEVGIDLGRGLRLDLRGGYQARTFAQGGPSLGGGLAYAF